MLMKGRTFVIIIIIMPLFNLLVNITLYIVSSAEALRLKSSFTSVLPYRLIGIQSLAQESGIINYVWFYWISSIYIAWSGIHGSVPNSTVLVPQSRYL